jgi:hypothetical protein
MPILGDDCSGGNTSETIAEFIQKQKSISANEQVALRDIIKLISSDPEWAGWWQYHAPDWDEKGWKPDDIIFFQDIPLLFNDEALQTDAKKYKMMFIVTRYNESKINSEGHYKPFWGSSIVASVGKNDEKKWMDLYASLEAEPSFNKYFALLPMKTWHMTDISLNISAEKTEPVKNAYLDSLAEKLKIRSFEPTITINSVYTVGIFVLGVTPDEKYVSELRGFAEEANLKSTADGEYHISVAYQFKPAPVSVLAALKQKYQRIITDIFGTGSVKLDSPKIYCFQSMSTFSEYNPVEKQKSKVCRELFFSHQDEEEPAPKPNDISGKTPFDHN